MTSMNIAHTGLATISALPAKWARRLRERSELMALLDQPDYILKDIGLQRHEITREGLKRFWDE